MKQILGVVLLSICLCACQKTGPGAGSSSSQNTDVYLSSFTNAGTYSAQFGDPLIATLF